MKPNSSLIVALIAAIASTALGAAPDYQSKYYAAGLSPIRPAFEHLVLDSLGQGKLGANPVLPESADPSIPGMTLEKGGQYRLHGQVLWQVVFEDRKLKLLSDYLPGVEAPPFKIAFNQRINHATLLGMMKPGERQMSLPCLLHMPDMGSLRITGNRSDLKLGYDARRNINPAFVKVEFPPANARQPHVEYQMEVAAIYPPLAGVENNALYDGFRRDWLNIFQVHPRLQMLANNASSDPCGFTLFEYSELAIHTPPLAEGLTANDLVRMTLDRYLSGAKGYGQSGYGCTPTDADVCPTKSPWTTLDTLPSFLIAAGNYIQSSGDLPWAKTNYDTLAAWGREMFAADKDGNGLIEHARSGNWGDRPGKELRPSNWWDTINFGHEDAFSNALAYHGATMFAQIAGQLGHTADAAFFAEKAARLRAAYAPTFLNPATGVLAGWKSADGKLHDYWFTFVQGVAITYGLLDDTTANSVMDHLLAKMKSVGYTNFSLGLPGNLVAIPKADYIFEGQAPEVTGEPLLDDGSDGFQFYENGGATGCWAYYTLKALYRLGRVSDARRIFHPMLEGYARGEFQGFDASGHSRDWRDWKGSGHGYEGLLVDNYHALLAVPDDLKAKP